MTVLHTDPYEIDILPENKNLIEEVVHYKLVLLYTPLSWNILSIRFALKNAVYFVIFCLLGLISLVIMLILWTYHIIWANICKRRYPCTETRNLKFYSYIK